MFSKKKSLILGIFAAVFLATGFWFYAGFDGGGSFSYKQDVNLASLFGSSNTTDTASTTNTTEPEYLPEYNGAVEGDRFIHEGFGFSFALPDGYKVQQLPYGEGFELVAVEKSSSEGFQISITPFDEMNPITPERIWIDLPEKIIKNPAEAALDGIPVLVFNGADKNIGDTFEVWFPYGGHLYQILTYRAFAGQLSRTLDTWKFTKR